LSRESSATSSVTSYDPPFRGIIDQNPVILEAEVSTAEAARLQSTPITKDQDGNPERRFVFIPKAKSESGQDNGPSARVERQDDKRPEQPRREGERLEPRPSLDRRRSRQDLPSIQTKVPRDLPQQNRRPEPYAFNPVDNDLTPQPPASRTPGEYLLSPDVPRGKDYFGAHPQHHRTSSFGRSGGTPINDKRKSGGSVPGMPRTAAPAEKRNSGNFENPRSRRNSIERLTRPQELSEEYRRRGRHGSTNSARLSAGGGSDRDRSGRSSSHSNRYQQSDSESDIADSGSDRGYRRSRLRPRDLQVDNGIRRSASRSNRSSLEVRSRQGTSPLPSPKGSPNRLSRGERERAETFPQRSGSRSPVGRPVSPFSQFDEGYPSDRLNPMDSQTRPRSRQSQTISTPTTATPSANRPVVLPMPLSGNPDHLKMPQIPPMEDNRSPSSRPRDSYWQPAPFQPPSNNLQKPVGSFRRYSEDVDRGSIVPLPSCPRTNYVRGKNDWLTLPKCSQFDICPSCFNSAIAPTEFRDFFIRAPNRPPDTEALCDFGSSPWYRIAWLLTRKERRRDLNLFYGLAKVAMQNPPCGGKHEAIRQWHSLIDPKTRNHIQNFNVCSSCVKSVEVLLPTLRGLFRPIDSKRPVGDPRVCDLRFDSKRFIQYFDALETAADNADELDAPPDTRALVSLCKRMSLFPECEHDTDLIDQHWNVITQLPEFTVCEECFDEVVWPELEDEKAIPMMFNKKLQKISIASCQLYSPKMRGIFRTAVDGNDYRLLANKARERKTVEMQFKKDLDALRRLGKQNPGVAAEIKRVEDEWRKWE